MNKKANNVKELKIQDPYNESKVWLIKKYSYHIKVTQIIAGKQTCKLQRISKNWLMQVFDKQPNIQDEIKML